MNEGINKLNDILEKDGKITQLYYAIYNGGRKINSQQFIDLYEQNRNLFEERDFESTTAVYGLAFRIIAEYAVALKDNGNDLKAIPYFNKAIKLLEYYHLTDLNKQTSELYHGDYYRLLKWTRGLAYYKLGKYKLAYQDFKGLALHFPKNGTYQIWLLNSQVKEWRKWELFFLCLTGFTGGMIYALHSHNVFWFRSDIFVFIIALTAVILIGIWKDGINKRLKKFYKEIKK